MAARTTGKAKQTGGSRTSGKAAAVKKVAGRKIPAKSAKTKAKSAKKRDSANAAMPADAMTSEMLQEQNAALRDELEQAHARIAELEELNKNVVNRIDWVIDSLQSALKR